MASKLARRYTKSMNPELLWRVARAHVEKAKLCADATEKRVLMFDAKKIIRRALALEGDDKIGAIHKWWVSRSP